MKAVRFVAITILLMDWAVLADEVITTSKKITAAKDRINVVGRWVVTSRLNSKAPLIAKVNSVEIICDRGKGTCHEAIAALYTREDVPQMKSQFLTTVISEYRITRWDASFITADAAKPVADVRIKIDLKNETAIRRHQETKVRGNQTANPDLVVEWELK